jgi:hypothetical protein
VKHSSIGKGIPASMQNVRGVPLAQFMRAISPNSPSVTASSTELKQLKAEAIRSTGMSVNQVNGINSGAGMSKGGSN